jgi:hypothetical protein
VDAGGVRLFDRVTGSCADRSGAEILRRSRIQARASSRRNSVTNNHYRLEESRDWSQVDAAGLITTGAQSWRTDRAVPDRCRAGGRLCFQLRRAQEPPTPGWRSDCLRDQRSWTSKARPAVARIQPPGPGLRRPAAPPFGRPRRRSDPRRARLEKLGLRPDPAAQNRRPGLCRHGKCGLDRDRRPVLPSWPGWSAKSENGGSSSTAKRSVDASGEDLIVVRAEGGGQPWTDQLSCVVGIFFTLRTGRATKRSESGTHGREVRPPMG